MERHHGDGAEEHDNRRPNEKETGERASTAGMGTHRFPMLGRRSYGDRFRDGLHEGGRHKRVTMSVARRPAPLLGPLAMGQIALPGNRVNVFDRLQPLHQPAELGQAADLDGAVLSS